MAFDPVYVVLGAGVGFIVGLTGVGGGSLMTPALVLLFGVHPATAVGTDLLFAAATKSVGSAVHGLRRNVDWRVVGLLAAGSVPAAVATLLLLAHLGPRTEAASQAISFALGVGLLLTAALLVFRRRLIELRLLRRQASDARTAPLTIAAGAAIGVLVSLSSIGAGALGAVLLLLLYPTQPVSRIVGTDIAHAVPLTLVAGLGHWMTGSVDLSMLASLAAGSLPATVLGSHLAPRAPDTGLRWLLAVVLFFAGAKLVV
jgi:uncharacterized protein